MTDTTPIMKRVMALRTRSHASKGTRWRMSSATVKSLLEELETVRLFEPVGIPHLFGVPVEIDDTLPFGVVDLATEEPA